jgi:hypothetical protein
VVKIVIFINIIGVLSVMNADYVRLDDVVEGYLQSMELAVFRSSIGYDPLPEIEWNEINADSYRTLPIKEVALRISYFDSSVKLIREQEKDVRRMIANSMKSLANMKESLSRKMINYPPLVEGMSRQDFVRISLQCGGNEFMAKKIYDKKTEFANFIKDSEKKDLAFAKRIDKTKEYCALLITEVKFIREFNNSVERLQKQNLTLEDSSVDNILKEMLYGKVSITDGMLKIRGMNAKKELMNSSIGSSNQNGKKESNENGYMPQFESRQINFLKSRGISASDSKHIIESGKYESVSKFMQELESILSNTGVSIEEARKIYSINSSLIMQKPSEQGQYIDALVKLYTMIDPRKVSGILPSNNPAAYADVKKIKSLEPKDRPQKTIVFTADYIPEDIREKTCKEIEGNAFPGEYVEKWKTGRSMAKMYRWCQEQVGEEGFFRKLKFKNGERVLLQMKRQDDGMMHFNVFKYFASHDEYTKDMGLNRR